MNCSQCSTQLDSSVLSLCASCADQQVNELQEQLSLLQKSIKVCHLFVDTELTNAGGFDAAALDQLNIEYDNLVSERTLLEQHYTELLKEQDEIDMKDKELLTNEEQLFLNYNIYQEELFQFKKQRHSLNAKVVKASEEYQYLQSVVDNGILKDIFKIGDINGYASIIKCRMGACKTTEDWLESNAAFGYCALLFNVMAQKLNLKFSRWEIQTLGSYSRLVNIEDKKSYPLFYQTETFAMLFFQRQNYNRALVGLLECLLELEHVISQRDDRFTVPYKIQKDLINSLTIQCTFDEVWSKACKCFLTNVKWVVAWVSRKD